LEFVVGILVSGIFSGAEGLFVTSENGEFFELTFSGFLGSFVFAERELEGEHFSTEFSNSVDETGDFTVESGLEFSEGFESLSFGFSGNGEGSFEVFFDVVKDSHEGVEHTVIGNFLGSFSDHGDNVEDLSITVSEGVFFSLEGSDVGGESGHHGGLDLEEFSITSESFLHDRSGLMHHGSDGVMLGNVVNKHSLLTVVFFTKSSKGSLSGTKFSFSGGFFSSSVNEDWGVNHDESFVFGDSSFEFILSSVHVGHFSSAAVSDFTVSGTEFFLVVSETFSNIFEHGDGVVNSIFGVGFEVKFNGLGNGFTKIGVF
jgi:hypothetical protein